MKTAHFDRVVEVQERHIERLERMVEGLMNTVMQLAQKPVEVKITEREEVERVEEVVYPEPGETLYNRV